MGLALTWIRLAVHHSDPTLSSRHAVECWTVPPSPPSSHHTGVLDPAKEAGAQTQGDVALGRTFRRKPFTILWEEKVEKEDAYGQTDADAADRCTRCSASRLAARSCSHRSKTE